MTRSPLLSIEESIEDTVLGLKTSPKSRHTAQVVPRAITNASGLSVGVQDTTIWPIIQYNKQKTGSGGHRVTELVIAENGDLMGRVITIVPGKDAACSWVKVVKPEKLPPQLRELVILGLEKIRRQL